MGKSLAAVFAGAGIAAVYYYLYKQTERLVSQIAPGIGLAVVLFSYLGRLAVVALLLLAATRLVKLDTFLTGVSLLVIYTIVLMLTHGRAGLAMLRNQVDGKD